MKRSQEGRKYERKEEVATTEWWQKRRNGGNKRKRNVEGLKKGKKGSSFVQECSFSFCKPRSSEYCLLSRDRVCECVCVCERERERERECVTG